MAIKTTKTLLVGLIILLTLLMIIQSCKKDENYNLIGTHFLKQDEAKTVSENGKKIKMKVIAIEDSRCPINANCVTAGIAKITLSLTDDTKEQTIEVCKVGCYLNLNTAVLNGTSYTFKLEDISPFPTLDKSIKEPAKAQIIISKTNP